MGECNASGSPWKNMEKSESLWHAPIKIEEPEGSSVTNSNDFSLDYNPFDGIPNEHFFNQSYDNQSSQSSDEPELTIVTDGDSPRRRRRGSGGKNETPEERAARLAKMSAYAAQRLAKETPEQRATRLKRMSEYAAKRLASETSEQRAKRLARMSAYAARRLAKETPEQRQARLSRMSAYAAKRQAMKRKVACTITVRDSLDQTSPEPTFDS